MEWDVPTPRYLFEAERDAGVRTAGLLARQASDRLEAIMRAISSVAFAVERVAELVEG